MAELKDAQSEIAQIVDYKDLVGNTHEQKTIVLMFMQLLEVQTRLLEDNIKTTTAASGASLDTESQACQGSGGDMHS